MDIVIVDTNDKYNFPIILGRLFFAQTSLIFDAEQGRTIIRTQKKYQVFLVTHLEYVEDLSQTPKWIFLKGVVEEHARSGVEEE